MTILRDRYRVIAPIGEGGMGAVFLAEDLRLPGRQCAVKQISLPAGAGTEALAEMRLRFAEEATVLARLDHPALPGVSDFFEVDGRSVLVMDYIAGNDLGAMMLDARSRGRWLDEHQVVRWAEDVCAALTYLHEQSPPIVHRDIKPSNIKLTPDGQVRLVDFGLAQANAEADGMTVTVMSGAGSRPYQPLEQYGGDGQVDGRADIYALGATLYHLLTGRAPPSAQRRFLAPDLLAPPATLRDGISPRVAAAIASAMAMHPDERPPSAEALRRLLVAPRSDRPDARPGAVRANVWLVGLVITLFLAALALTMVP